MGSNHSIHVVRGSTSVVQMIKEAHINDKDAVRKFMNEKVQVIFNDKLNKDESDDDYSNTGRKWFGKGGGGGGGGGREGLVNACKIRNLHFNQS